jgi:demethylmenaquinone methyltransferase / 2-methoxy-6-polyprenyl-1,4-benzoquinol methylase
LTQYQHDTIVPYKGSDLPKKKQVEEMFDGIAFRYDFLNRFLSFGIDVGWRKKAIRQLGSLQPANLLDVATGTGDMAILAAKRLQCNSIIGIDISDKMLEIGRQKVSKARLSNTIQLLKGDSETISFGSESFDAVTVAFGVRNFENLEGGLTEILRVMKPGGKLVVLEFSRPTAPIIKQFYNLYMNRLCPWIGKLFSKNKAAYQYLNDSVKNFPEGKDFVAILEKLGFRNTSRKPLSLGICSIYCGEK